MITILVFLLLCSISLYPESGLFQKGTESHIFCQLWKWSSQYFATAYLCWTISSSLYFASIVGFVLTRNRFRSNYFAQLLFRSFYQSFHNLIIVSVAAVFSLAYKLQPAIIFIDEVDSFLGQRRTTDHEALTNMKTEFMALWDGFTTDRESFTWNKCYICVIFLCSDLLVCVISMICVIAVIYSWVWPGLI